MGRVALILIALLFGVPAVGISASESASSIGDIPILGPDIERALSHLETNYGEPGEEHADWLRAQIRSGKFEIDSNLPILQNRAIYRGIALPPRKLGGKPVISLRPLSLMQERFPNERENLDAFISVLTEEIEHALEHARNASGGGYEQAQLDAVYIVLDQLALPTEESDLSGADFTEILNMCVFVESRFQPIAFRLAMEVGLRSGDHHSWNLGRKASQCGKSVSEERIAKEAVAAVLSTDYKEFLQRLSAIDRGGIKLLPGGAGK